MTRSRLSTPSRTAAPSWSARPYKSKVLVSLQSAQMNDDSLTLVNVRACAVACSVEVVGVCRVDNCAVL